MIHIIIVDDEPLARKGINQLLSTEKDVEVIAECEDGISALESIDRLKPDLVFLDIQMPELDGFEVLSGLEQEPLPLIVFATAYDEYALNAFNANAVDYLLKPIDKAKFHATMDRVRLILHSKNEQNYIGHLKNLLLQVQKRPEFLQRLLVRKRNKLIIIPIENVNVFEADGDYVSLITLKDRHLIRKSLTELEQKLNPTLFLRINRSTIIRTNLISELEPLSKGDYQLKLSDGKSYLLSRKYREHVLKALQ